jgi:hypothetical protein
MPLRVAQMGFLVGNGVEVAMKVVDGVEHI